MKQVKKSVQLWFLIMTIAIVTTPALAQVNYRFGPASGPGGATGKGYTVADQKVTFYNTATSALSTTDVTVSLSNQQYGNATANKFEGMTDPVYSGGVGFGAAGTSNTGSNTVPDSFACYANLGLFGSPANTNFTINKLATAGTGMTTAAGALSMSIFTDVLINNAGDNINGLTDLNTDIQFADVTLTFNEPVSNPVIHLGGLGGTTDIALGTTHSWLAYTAVFELLDTYSINRLSGSAKFDANATTKQAKDTAYWLGFVSSTTGSCFGGRTVFGASGSFVVNATNITSLSFRLYLRSDAGRMTSSHSPACNGTFSTEIPFTATGYPRWAPLTYIRADGFTLSVSFARSKITGNVFNDPDAGNVDNSSGTANLIPSGIYANLVDAATGLVIKSVPVGTNGVFDFGDQNANNYKVVLSSSLGTAGALPPSYTAPAGWVNTGAFNGDPNTGNTGNTSGVSTAFDVTEAANTIDRNFGIRPLIVTPVTLASFTVSKAGEKALLNWVTASEQNNKGFEIERSNNGNNWNSIGFIASSAPNGNSTDLLSYSFADPSPFAGVNYYRLKQTDRDGRYVYSGIRFAKFDKTTVITVSPNPVTEQLNIALPVSVPNAQTKVELYNAQGKLLQVTNAGNDQFITIGVGNLPAGIYYVKVLDKNKTLYTGKVCKR